MIEWSIYFPVNEPVQIQYDSQKIRWEIQESSKWFRKGIMIVNGMYPIGLLFQ